jgi:hypothetical protein
MYRLSKNVRKYSPTPIVRVTVGEDGHESEEIVLISTQKKKDGEALSEMIVRLLNAEEANVFQQ